jgi:hypothetical protein
MNHGILELIFFFVIEDDAILIQKLHNGSLPSGRAQEVYYYVEEPILYQWYD